MSRRRPKPEITNVGSGRAPTVVRKVAKPIAGAVQAKGALPPFDATAAREGPAVDEPRTEFELDMIDADPAVTLAADPDPPPKKSRRRRRSAE